MAAKNWSPSVATAALAVTALLALGVFSPLGIRQSTSAAAMTTTTTTENLDCSKIAKDLGGIAVPNGPVCDVVVVRQAPQIIGSNNLNLNQFTLMNSVLEFRPVSSNQVHVMGDFALLETEMNDVLSAVKNYNWTVTGIHNHMINETPKTTFMHWEVQGNLDTIVDQANQAFAKTSIKGQQTATAAAAGNLQCKDIAGKLGGIAVPNGPVCDVVVVRQNPQITGADGSNLNEFTLMNSVLEFLPLANNTQQVYVMGDFALLETEMNDVLSAVKNYNWTVTGIHNHMINETPKASFMHWEVQGDLGTIIDQANKAFAKTSIKGTTSSSPVKLTVNAVNDHGSDLRMWIRVGENGTIISEGFAPFEFTGVKGHTYQVRATNFDRLVFDHWADDGSTNRHRMITLNSDMQLTATYAPAANISYDAQLSGSKEVPPVDTTATGSAIFKLNADATQLTYKLNVTGIDNVTMAHLHLSPEGVNGPIIVVLYNAPPGGQVNGVLAQGTITSADLTGPLAGKPLIKLLDEISSGQVYVNVHSTEHPGGEIRGQLS